MWLKIIIKGLRVQDNTPSNRLPSRTAFLTKVLPEGHNRKQPPVALTIGAKKLHAPRFSFFFLLKQHSLKVSSRLAFLLPPNSMPSP